MLGYTLVGGPNADWEEGETEEAAASRFLGLRLRPAYLPVLFWLLLPTSLGATPSPAQQEPNSTHTSIVTFQDPRCLTEYMPLVHQALLAK